MFLDPVDSFLTMQQAATALQKHLDLLLDDAQSRADSADVTYYEERIRYTTDLASHADPDDIFEQDAFRRLFTAELAELPRTPDTA